MQRESFPIRPDLNQKRGDTGGGGHELLDGHELAQERLYVSARIGWIDQKRFAQRARQLEKDHGACDCLKWLIQRHPDIPSYNTVDPAFTIGRRELRRAKVSWQAKALAKGNAKRKAKLSAKRETT